MKHKRYASRSPVRPYSFSVSGLRPRSRQAPALSFRAKRRTCFSLNSLSSRTRPPQESPLAHFASGVRELLVVASEFSDLHRSWSPTLKTASWVPAVSNRDTTVVPNECEESLLTLLPFLIPQTSRKRHRNFSSPLNSIDLPYLLLL